MIPGICSSLLSRGRDTDGMSENEASMHTAFPSPPTVSPPRDKREGQRYPESSLYPLDLSTLSLTIEVTGAGHGIGKELAIGYASLGATVVCWDINEETNKQTMNEIKMMGKNAVYAYQCNVTDREEVFKVAGNVREEVGDVTILVNNAGAVCIKKLLDQSADEIVRIIDINLISHYWASDI
ncbi:Epidermal retinal dehydrogenase 2 [Camponotus floridanus]|uniref:Epidermal retinal dehydrogenase 2 n=1 Tax=Camponotus floridanus TaxID=104421 RepID=E2AUR5_CAMFO|nr:Epidermal retinal dehydrogenase 2 [Camponotus floridanus]